MLAASPPQASRRSASQSQPQATAVANSLEITDARVAFKSVQRSFALAAFVAHQELCLQSHAVRCVNVVIIPCADQLGSGGCCGEVSLLTNGETGGQESSVMSGRTNRKICGTEGRGSASSASSSMHHPCAAVHGNSSIRTLYWMSWQEPFAK